MFNSRKPTAGSGYLLISIATSTPPAPDASTRVTSLCYTAVTGHEISAEQLDAVFSQLKAAFAMPLEAKQAIIADEHNRGWTPFAEETLDPTKQSKGDTKEGFYFGRWVSTRDFRITG